MVACTAVTAPASTPSCAAGGTHATRIESYLRIKRDTAANSWEVTNRDGTRLTYQPVGTWTTYGTGTDEVRRATDFRWLLATVVDTHGTTNTVQYTYACDGVPDCYIDTIAYNGNTIRFHRESRTDPISYATGAGLGQINNRIKTIDVQVGGQRLRAYKLSYAYGTSTGRSRLASVQQFGKDAVLDGTNTVTGGTALPPVAFSYSDAPNTIASTPWVNGVNSPGSWLVGDFNGDGRTDFINRQMTVSCRLDMRLSTGTGFAFQQWTVTPASGVSCNPYPYTSPALGNVVEQWATDDFNGDGKTDLLVHCCAPSNTGGTGSFTAYVYLSTGSGFTISKWFNTVIVDGRRGWDRTIGDFNGDGMTDVFIQDLPPVTPPPNPNGEPTYPNCRGRVWYSGGASFTMKATPVPSCKKTWATNPNVVRYFFRGSGVGDFEGDGRADLQFQIVNGSFNSSGDFIVSTLSLNIRLGNANKTFTDTGNWLGIGGLNPVLPGATADVNGDGRADKIRLETDGTVKAYLSTGAVFAGQPLSARPAGACSNCEVRFGDFDGDGATDILTTQSGITTANYTAQISIFAWRNGALVGQSWGTGLVTHLFGMHSLEFDGDGKSDLLTSWTDANGWSAVLNRSTGPVPDLLTGITGSLGGSTAVTYAPSSQWTNTNLPLITQTTASITANDGRGTASTTTYSYAGGLWNVAERRFLGFASVTATLPKNADELQPPTIASTFLQNVCAYPKPLVTEEKDGAGTVLRKTEEEYSVCNPSTLPYTSLNTATTTTVYDGAASKSAKVTRVFNMHGNITQLTRHGDLARTGDEITTVTDFYPSATAYIVNRPARTADHAGTSAAGTKLAESRTFYDGAGAHTAVPTKGDATKVEQWLDGPPSRYIPSTASYDSRGNVLTQSDALGNCTGFVYDTTYNLFVTETRDPLFFAPGTCNPTGGDARHKTTANWDFACGLPTETRDLNNQPTTSEYETLCRPRKVTTPGGGFSCMNYIGLGAPLTQHIETQTVPPAPETPSPAAPPASPPVPTCGRAHTWTASAAPTRRHRKGRAARRRRSRCSRPTTPAAPSPAPPRRSTPAARSTRPPGGTTPSTARLRRSTPTTTSSPRSSASPPQPTASRNPPSPTSSTAPSSPTPTPTAARCRSTRRSAPPPSSRNTSTTCSAASPASPTTT
jgi:Insecticide toxin TcdB middle/N-terminal region/FG-GAP-like repeat